MPQFFIRAEDIIENRCILTGSDTEHLVRVRRIEKGNIVDLRDDARGFHKARVDSVEPGELTVTILESDTSGTNIQPEIILCMSLIKGKKFDLAIQKAVEVGVTRIVPVTTQRSVPEIGGKEKSKVERWTRIAKEASKQCMSSVQARITDVLDFKSCIKTIESEARFIAHTDPGASPSTGLRNQDGQWAEYCRGAGSLALLVGPEGGFSQDEVALAEEAGWKRLHFGCTQLRAETAAIVLPALILHEWSKGREYCS